MRGRSSEVYHKSQSSQGRSRLQRTINDKSKVSLDTKGLQKRDKHMLQCDCVLIIIVVISCYIMAQFYHLYFVFKYIHQNPNYNETKIVSKTFGHSPNVCLPVTWPFFLQQTPPGHL